MREAESNLALAARRPGGEEDRLTEVLAGVLALDQRLARTIVNRVPGRTCGETAPVAITTQLQHEKVGRLDMWLDAAGQRCWVENKLRAAFQFEQLERYAKLGPGLVIVPRDRVSEVDRDSRWVVLSWADVAEMATELFDDEALSLEEAQSGSGLAMHKARADLVGYLTELNLVTPRRLNDDDAVTLANVDFVLLTAIPKLLEAVQLAAEAQGLSDSDPNPPPKFGWYHLGYVTFGPELGEWVSEVGGRYETIIDGRPDFADVPSVGVGVTVYTEVNNAAQEIFQSDEWTDVLVRAGFRRTDTSWGFRAFKTFALGGGVIPGSNLDEQAQHIAEQFTRARADARGLQAEWDRLKATRAANDPSDVGEV